MDDGTGLPHSPGCGYISVHFTELFLYVFNCIVFKVIIVQMVLKYCR